MPQDEQGSTIVQRIDVAFDTYIKKSFKASKREKRGCKKGPVGKITEDGLVPLPKVWSQFIAFSVGKQMNIHS